MTEAILSNQNDPFDNLSALMKKIGHMRKAAQYIRSIDFEQKQNKDGSFSLTCNKKVFAPPSKDEDINNTIKMLLHNAMEEISSKIDSMSKETFNDAICTYNETPGA